MQVYSVFNHATQRYDYYRSGAAKGTHAPTPSIPTAQFGGIGVPPERAAWKVPIGATRIGSGDLPRGRISSLGSADMGTPIKLVVGIGAIFLALKVIGGKK